MSSHAVSLTEDAFRDLEGLYSYIATHDSFQKADFVLQKLEASFNSLSQFPDRGSYPKELLSLGIREYREIYFKPYRIIYRVIEKNVYIYFITDGRRNIQDLLEERLLRA